MAQAVEWAFEISIRTFVRLLSGHGASFLSNLNDLGLPKPLLESERKPLVDR
jgi:hypothetical protein